ncbi:MAG: hypothetical protein IKK74_06470 [Clostridia bacterium]|nr:hypothetical protein [Clostridia bacterium]
MRSKAKIAIYCTAAVLTILVLFGTAFTVTRARNEKSRYVESEKKLALLDLRDALNEMEKALLAGDSLALNRAAGMAEAYLSRAGLGDTPEVYRTISLIASGEYGDDECKALIDAVKNAINGNVGALRGREARTAEIDQETTEDMLASRMLERIGKGKDDVALARATAFACPNALFSPAICDDGCFKYSGDNIFIAVGGSNSRVLMYCFERELDPNHSVSEEDALQTAVNVIKREKLKLRGEAHTELQDGIYRSVWYKDESKEPLVVLEIYSDTGRLRLYDAVNYYNSLS